MARFKVTVPIDATSVGTVEKGHPLKVVARDAKGRVQSQVVKLDGAKATATFSFDEKPEGLRVFVAPHDVPDQDVERLQTVVSDVPARLLTRQEITIPAITIAPFFWEWWLRWCRNFTIHGRVVCPDGNPVPGARVCAYDVDWFWWWRSTQQVGDCVMTDGDGAFTINFRWCCGWWPWWWWRLRDWRLDLGFYTRIIERLPPELKVRRIPLPDPVPDLKVFSHLLSQGPRPQPLLKEAAGIAALSPAREATIPIDLAAAERLREPLMKAVAKIPEVDLIRPWPWWPWSPWYDCAPDVIFRVTQDCDTIGTVIVDESWAQVRWDIPTNLNVTLVANSQACCTRPPRPEENCLVFTQVCNSYDIQLIGAPDAPVTSPLGYYNPGHGDQPFGGQIKIFGSLETMTNAEYYEFVYEKATDGTGTMWGAETTIPIATAGVIPRKYFDHTLPTPDWISVNFVPEVFDGHTIYESLRHYEAMHPPNNWWDPHGRDWNLATVDLMLPWNTSSDLVGDGLYRLHVKGYDKVAGALVEKDVFICNERRTPYIYLRIDNRVAEDAAHHMGPAHACGGDNVHYCVVEPDTDIISVRNITTGDSLVACSTAKVADTDRVEIVFFAYDPDGHLQSFDIEAHWGDGHHIPLIPCGTLDPGPPLSDPPPPATTQTSYTPVADAQWKGGTYKLTVPGSCFRDKPCCYLLKLHAVKRTIVSCSGVHDNYSEISFMVDKP